MNKKPLFLAVLLALSAGAEAGNNDDPYFSAVSTTNAVTYNGEELTPSPHNDGEAIRVINGGDLTLTIADGKTLKIDSQVSRDANLSNRTYGSVIQVVGSKAKILGGAFEANKADSYAAEENTDPQNQSYFWMDGNSGNATLSFETAKTSFTGSVRYGAVTQGKTDLTFKNGVSMEVDRSESLSATTASALYIYNTSLSTPSTLTVGGDSTFTIRTGVNDTYAQGIMLFMGVKSSFNGKNTLTIDTSKSAKLKSITALQNYNQSIDPVKNDFISNGAFTIDVTSNGVAPALGVVNVGTMSFDDLNLKFDQVGVGSIGILSPAAAQNNRIDIDRLTFNATNTKPMQALQAGAGTVNVREATINFADPSSNLALNAFGAGWITVSDSLSIKADIAMRAKDKAQIDVKKNFETTSDSLLFAGIFDNELPQATAENPNPVKPEQAPVVKINSSGEGLVRFTGATILHNHDAGSALEMTVGSINTALTDQSFWNVTSPSLLTKLTLGKNARLNFYIDDKSPVYNVEEASMITIEGNNPVTLTKDSGSGISLVVSGVELKKDDTLGLILSPGGFTLDGSTLAAGADLEALKKEDLSVTEIASISRLSESKLTADRYDLLMQTDKRLIAKIKEKKVTPPDPKPDAKPDPKPGPQPDPKPDPKPEPKPSVINPQTDSLMESSVSTFGTLFAADDLFVDSVLRSRDGAHQEGLFAVARAGKWSLNTRTDVDMTAVTGLVGYAARAGATEFGGFLEMGHSSYDTMTPAKLGDVKGTGRHNYAGLGLYVDYATPVDGLALTGYVKAGAFSNHFNATLVNEKVDFDRTKVYWDMHLGAHYDWNVEKLRNRTFFSYFYDGTESSSYRIADSEKVSGATFDYDALNAHRVQVGNLMEYALSDTLRPYFGVTLEKTLSAKAKGSATDSEGTLALHSSTMDGTTGILSAGWSYLNPAATFEFGVGVNGYIGARQGATAQVQANWKF